MAKTIESRLKKLDKMISLLVVKHALLEEVYEHLFSQLNTIIMANKNIEQRLEDQGKTLEKILAEQTAARELYNEQKGINQELRAELDRRNANDGAVARLLDRSDELVKQIDDLYADAPPATGGETPTGEQPGTEQSGTGDNPPATEEPATGSEQPGTGDTPPATDEPGTEQPGSIDADGSFYADPNSGDTGNSGAVGGSTESGAGSADNNDTDTNNG
ncbi:MAG TPA: hypothetical protein VL098_12550 [Flavipsychrobacter sp.]|nr:hypothetical protein [Flavipsychrobacter sp.]